jgi:manganese/zinc/iron transport system permease protein
MIALGITEKVMLGTALLGAVAGAVGCFAVLRRRALVGDMLAHAALPGVCLAFLVTGSRNLLGLSIGALVTGLLGVAIVSFVCRWTRTKEDAAIGIVLSTFFGAGVVLLSLIQRLGSGNQAGLDSYLFGETAAIQRKDIQLLAITAILALVLLIALFKEFKLLSFDGDFAHAQGWPITGLDMLMMGMLATVTIIGLPIVGVILMAALLIIPGAAARFWTDRLGHMLLISSGLGAAAGILGTWLSTPLPHKWLGFDPLGFGVSSANLPPGPLIVLAATTFFIVSIFFAPRRGIIARLIAEIRLRRRILREHMLRALYELSEPSLPELPIVAEARMIHHRGWSRLVVGWWLHRAEQNGWIYRISGTVQLTESGLREAAAVTKTHRLWELFLMEQADIPADHVDRDADDVEHLLPRPLLERLEARLAATGRLPQVVGGLPRSPHKISPE